MIKKYNRLSLLFGVPGFFLQGFLFIWGQEVWGLLGVLLFMIGISFHARSLGRTAWWGLTGILGWFSLIILIFLKDRSSSKNSLKKLIALLPPRVGQFTAEPPKTYESEAYGMSVGYNAPDGTTLTIYLYDLGLPMIPEGISSEVIGREKESAVMAIRENEKKGQYRDLVFSADGSIVIPLDRGRRVEALCVNYRSGLQLPDGSFSLVESMLCLTGIRGYIIKIRASWNRGRIGDGILDTVKTLISDLVK